MVNNGVNLLIADGREKNNIFEILKCKYFWMYFRLNFQAINFER